MIKDPVRVWQKTSQKKRNEIAVSMPVLYAIAALRRLERLCDSGAYKEAGQEVKLTLANLYMLLGVTGGEQ